VAPPIEGRFLFVDVAAQRAKQLRRGALPRLPELRGDAGPSAEADKFHKLERVAMEEVARGLIAYTLPHDPRRPGGTA
jgi:DNA-directed RNA polymerase subunit K/omega